MTHGDKHPVVGGNYLVVELKEKKKMKCLLTYRLLSYGNNQGQS